MKHVKSKNERDRAAIMAVVRRFGPLSRMDIHKLTHFRPSTISLLVRELIDEGRLLRGHGETVGEFGHTHVIADGPPCKCGSFGCLEAIASAPALAAKARKAVLEGSNSHVTSRFGHPLPTF